MDIKTTQQNILEELDLQDLPEETQVALLTQMTESLLKRITLAVLEKLPEPDRAEFDKLQEAGDAEKIDQFLKAKIPDYEQMLGNIVAEFKEEMKTNIETLKKV